MPIYHTTTERWGRIAITSERNVIDKEGNQHMVPGLSIGLVPSWFVQDATEPIGPEMIDTDNLLPGDAEACERHWGDDWKKKLIEWLEKPANVRRFGFTKGDMRGKQKLTITMTREEYEAVKEMTSAAPVEKKKPSTITGTRTTGRR